MPSPCADVAVVVLCGGTSARMGGRDKTRELVAGVSMLDRLLDGLPPRWPVWCVGEPRPTTREVRWTREHPPGGGPVAGIAAGLQALAEYDDPDHDGPGPAVTVVLGGDQPFAGSLARPLAQALTAQSDDVDAVAAAERDRPARPQLLLAAYRTVRLRQALAGGPVEGAGVYRTLAPLRVATLPVDPATLLDVDTPQALAVARRHAVAGG